VEGENLPVDVNEELRVRGYQIKFVLKIEKYPELITQTKVFQNRSPFCYVPENIKAMKQ
jgi:hypothetical protein